MRVIELRFTSQDWKGLPWTHPARTMCQTATGGNAGIIGTERHFFDEPASPRHTIPGTTLDTEAEYAEGTAIDLGMPVMLFANPAEDYWGMNESDLAGYALKKVMETGDLTWNGYYPIAMAYLRAITLMHALPRRARRARGADGLLQARRCGQHRHRRRPRPRRGRDGHLLLRRQQPVLSCAQIRRVRPRRGRTGAAAQRAWLPARRRRAAGDQQPHGPAHADALRPVYVAQPDALQLPGGARHQRRVLCAGHAEQHDDGDVGRQGFLAVDNLPHTWVSAKHLAAWRMWMAHTFLGRKLPAIEARGTAQGAQYAVQARVKADAPPAGVRLFHACNPVTVDWRKAK
ncbi:hypothetical protein PO002_01365 [Cupriavidus necator]